jgi:hypothetical protein
MISFFTGEAPILQQLVSVRGRSEQPRFDAVTFQRRHT